MMAEDPKLEWPEDIHDAAQACDVLMKALYAGFDSSASEEGSSSQEKMMAIALHYGDALADQKDLLKKAYGLVLCSPHYLPASYVWSMAGQWLKAIGLETHTVKDGWRSMVLLTAAHRMAQAWFKSANDDDWLQSVDAIITQTWPFMCEGHF